MPKGIGYKRMVDTARAHNGVDRVTHPNARVNMGKAPKTGAPKDTTDGKDTGPHATNSMGQWTNEEMGQSSTEQSANR
jgi:hypothetical protein